MSYFIVISGKLATSVEVASGQLLPLSDAQSYVANLGPKIAALDGSPSFFWADGKTGTSHELVSAVEEDLFEKSPLEASALAQLIKSCESHQASARVWWATNDLDAFAKVAETRSASEALALLHNQVGKGPTIGFAMHPNYSLKRTAAE